ncbi:MAG: 4-hydroxythreonine-4-phosphate dehydrogenase PdxA [Gammaproteobacteria bacterium]|nr:4-hydroxythreonine-4-phosphate dehydrogenase PdxA [Gammaproteobacteria bacterium]
MSRYEANQPVRLAVTPGEPAGIGPELCVQSYSNFSGEIQPIYFADPDLLRERARLLGVDITLNDWSTTKEFVSDKLNYFPIPLQTTCEVARLDPANAPYVMACLSSALALCQAGSLQAMVTGPVNKAVINDAGIVFSGHTEWLAKETGTPDVVMMFVSDSLKIALATTHLPLRAVPDAINRQSLRQVIQITMAELETKFGIDQPRLLVCGLNPHAGEGGHLGTEETEVIIPVLAELSKTGLQIEGPVPADTAFTEHRLATTDAVLVMYHDQGLPVLKHQGFGEAVNVTLGLPVIRTSVDHGTALDLAGTGKGDCKSLKGAIECAARLARTFQKENEMSVPEAS